MLERVRVSRLPLWVLIVFGLVMAAVAGLGAWLTILQSHSLRNGIENDLLSICELKVSQIASWRTERLSDADSLARDPSFAAAVERWLSTRSDSDVSVITGSLQSIVDIYGYSAAALVDTTGRVALSTAVSGVDLAPAAVAAEKVALLTKKTVPTDLYAIPGSTTIIMDVIAPIIPQDRTTPVACMLLRINASTYLYPVIESWPVPRRSAETMLLRRDGDQALYLNDLRYLGGSALNLRVPLTQTAVPAVKAVLGQTGVVEGQDYRGVQVLAALEPVPNSSWYVEAKVDAAEALGPLRTRTALVGAMLTVLLLALLGGGALLWEGSARRSYKAAYESSLADHAVLQRFHFLVQEAQDAILLADEQRHIIDANDRALELYGYPREEFLQLRMVDIVPPDMRSHYWERMQALTVERKTTHEIEGLRKDGSRFPGEVSDTLFEVEGQPLLQAIIRDTTERKRAEQERLDLELRLQHSQRLESLGVLAGGIAHDFNNILTAILGYADLTLYELPPSTPSRENVEEIVSASHRAAGLCRQMLAYSGRGRFVIESIDVGRLVTDMLQLLSSSVPKKVVLKLDLAGGLPLVRGDVSQLNQVVMNLVINAAEAIGDTTGEIIIATGLQDCTGEYLAETSVADNLPAGPYVTIEISDTGEGMDEETMDKLFEPFFTTKFTGRGLGLSAVLGIVRGHKGAIRVHSKIGKGTTFKVLLPAMHTDSSAEMRRVGERSEEWKGQGTILLADDEATIRSLGRRMLERLGFEVLLASDGREVVELFSRHAGQVTLVVLDLTMPNVDGEEALRMLQEIDPETRVLLSSGYVESDLAARFAGRGLAGFIQKPYTLAKLREKVRQALA